MKCTAIQRRLPATSSSWPTSVCGPAAKAAAYVAVAPARSGAGAAAPSIVAFAMPERFSVAVTTSEPAAATSSPSDGTDVTRAGAVLSTMTVRTGELAALPALSVARARRS